MFVVFSCQSGKAATQEIAAVVNDDAISLRDLNKRLGLFMASSGLPNTPEIRERLKPQVLDGLISEMLMMQEARRLEIEVTKEEIEKGVATIAAQNKMKPDVFKGMLKKGGVNISTMEKQVEAQIAWTKVIQKLLRPRVRISDRDIDDMQERLQAKLGTTEYLAAEIFLPVDSEKKAKPVRALANRLVKEIKSGKASFFKLAQQFSKAAGSTKGGDTGWLQEDQIDEEILAALRKVSKNQITNVIKTVGGYHIFFLRETRTLTEDTLPSRQQIEYNLGMERLDKLQRRHLMDLRGASFVDIRA